MTKRFESILCPVDPAAPSAVALQHAVTLGEWCAAEVTALAVRPHGRRAGRMPVAGRPGSQPADDASLETQIRQLSSQNVGVQVAHGAVGQEILRAARANRADLIVMTTREVGRIERLLFGSVIEHVLSHTPAPVLVLPPGAGPPASAPEALFDRIVCGVDRSPESRRALEYALSLARREVAVVHALEDFSEEDPRFARHFTTLECWREVEPEIRAGYEELVPRAARQWCEIEVVVPLGRAGAVLTAAAESRQASLVAIGTAGWHSSCGTTARYVIRRAPCPVLAVPRRKGRAQGVPRARASAAHAGKGES